VPSVRVRYRFRQCGGPDLLRLIAERAQLRIAP